MKGGGGVLNAARGCGKCSRGDLSLYHRSGIGNWHTAFLGRQEIILHVMGTKVVASTKS